jgi:tetratricopeptide (TPR) repeat protein
MDSEAEAKVNKLLSSANVARMRGSLGEAEQLVRQALEISPDNPVANELLGDIYLQDGKVEEAKAAFKLAMEKSPGNATLETKHARAALASANLQIFSEMSPGGSAIGAVTPKSVGLLGCASIIVPGAGQILLGQTVKGIVFLGAYLVSLAFSAKTILGLFNAVLPAGMSQLRAQGKSLDTGSLTGYVFFAILGVVWFAALIDVLVSAKMPGGRQNSGWEV